MRHVPLRRLLLLATTLLTVLLALPVIAQADDRSFARTAIRAAVTLGRHERATSDALARVDSGGLRAVPAARRAIKLVRRQLDRMTAAVKPQQTSTQDGASAKRKLNEVLAAEKNAYGTLDRALAAFQDGDTTTARTLLDRAKRAIARIRTEAARLGTTLQKLAET